MMQIFRGSPALSDFRLNQLMTQFRQAELPISDCYAEYLHFADLSEALTEQENGQLEQLLHYGPTLAEHEPNGNCFIVIPRVGTISSWSSKASDIAHNSGFHKVKRVER